MMTTSGGTSVGISSVEMTTSGDSSRSVSSVGMSSDISREVSSGDSIGVVSGISGTSSGMSGSSTVGGSRIGSPSDVVPLAGIREIFPFSPPFALAVSSLVSMLPAKPTSVMSPALPILDVVMF